MNPNPSGNRDVIELWGREFNLVKNGLSEAQVVSFVNDLAKQHDVLLQRQEHLTSLTRLAEKTVSEADKLADEIKEEARKQADDESEKIISAAKNEATAQSNRILSDAEASAKAQSQRILSDAEARAAQMIKEKEAHAMAAAAEQAEAIKDTAEKDADEMKKEAEAEAKRIVSEAESRGRHIVEQKEAEATASANEQARVIIENARKEASTLLEREKVRIQPEVTQFIRNLRSQLLSELDDIKIKVGSLESQFSDNITEPAPAPREEKRVEKTNRAERPDTFMDLVKDADQSEDDDSEPSWEIEIVPPINIMKIMSIVSYLDSLPEVSRTEIIPRNERTSVIVYSNDDTLELVELIRELPEVSSAEEITLSDEGNDRPRNITIALSGKDKDSGSVSEEDVLHDAAK